MVPQSGKGPKYRLENDLDEVFRPPEMEFMTQYRELNTSRPILAASCKAVFTAYGPVRRGPVLKSRKRLGR